jgi:hypothetical protein
MNNIGQIAKIKCLEFSRENLPTGVSATELGSLFLCSDIDPTYPVLGALKTSMIPVTTSSVGVIIAEHSRPRSFQKGPAWNDYDILSVYIEGELYKCFRLSLEILAPQNVRRE